MRKPKKTRTCPDCGDQHTGRALCERCKAERRRLRQLRLAEGYNTELYAQVKTPLVAKYERLVEKGFALFV